jgi:hypothetical protein
MLNKRNTNKPRDAVDVIVAILTLVGWFFVVAINNPGTNESIGYSRTAGVDIAIYAGLSVIFFFLVLPLVRLAVKHRWPWNIVVSAVIATIIAYFAYYALAIAIFSFQ